MNNDILQECESDEISEIQESTWFPRFSKVSKMDKLKETEYRIFSNFGIEYFSKFVSIPFNNSKIYTIQVNSEETVPKYPNPIVLIHGFAAGVALWSSLLKRLAQFQTIYAFDLLGFGRSSRPKFSDDPKVAEQEFVESIEMWRNKMKIEKMNLVAHSFGGFLATSYAIKYPDRVDKLILADPWGFNEFNPEKLRATKAAIFYVFNMFSPLLILRMVGSYGPSLIRKLRPDLKYRYSDEVYEYVYLCNSQKPTGEEAFKCISENLAWPKHSMSKRFDEIDHQIPVTFIHGEHSWIDRKPAQLLAEAKAHHVDSYILNDAGHHVYADSTEEFVEIILEAMKKKRNWSNEQK